MAEKQSPPSDKCVCVRGGFHTGNVAVCASGNVFIVGQPKLPFSLPPPFLHLPEWVLHPATPPRDGQQVYRRVTDQNFAKYPDCNVKESTPG